MIKVTYDHNGDMVIEDHKPLQYPSYRMKREVRTDVTGSLRQGLYEGRDERGRPLKKANANKSVRQLITLKPTDRAEFIAEAERRSMSLSAFMRFAARAVIQKAYYLGPVT
jgi:hypothetical protein